MYADTNGNGEFDEGDELCDEMTELEGGVYQMTELRYAVSVAYAIAELLDDMKDLLSSCDCGSACSKCLKHYRNQYVHGMLDRFAALQLLRWGVEGINAPPINVETQIKMISPLINILEQSGCKITIGNNIIATG